MFSLSLHCFSKYMYLQHDFIHFNIIMLTSRKRVGNYQQNNEDINYARTEECSGINFP